MLDSDPLSHVAMAPDKGRVQEASDLGTLGHVGGRVCLTHLDFNHLSPLTWGQGFGLKIKEPRPSRGKKIAADGPRLVKDMF